MLPPALRALKRYVVFEVVSDGPVQYEDIVSAVWDSMLSFLGELAASEARIWFINNLYQENQRGVVKCTHDHVEQVRAALSLVSMVGETKAVIRVVGVTGTIKSARTKYLGAEA